MKLLRKRSVAKAITYRVLSFIVGTAVLSVAAGSFAFGISTSMVLVVTNTLLFYGHDLGWSKIEWGKDNDA